MSITKPQSIKLSKYAHIPLFSYTVQAGFPSPAEDSVERKLNLHQLLIPHPAATFFVRAQGDSMQGSGIFSNDLLIVDRSIPARAGMIVIACVDGEFTVKKLTLVNGKPHLLATNPSYRPILVEESSNIEIWGVVTYVIHQV